MAFVVGHWLVTRNADSTRNRLNHAQQLIAQGSIIAAVHGFGINLIHQTTGAIGIYDDAGRARVSLHRAIIEVDHSR